MRMMWVCGREIGFQCTMNEVRGRLSSKRLVTEEERLSSLLPYNNLRTRISTVLTPPRVRKTDEQYTGIRFRTGESESQRSKE